MKSYNAVTCDTSIRKCFGILTSTCLSTLRFIMLLLPIVLLSFANEAFAVKVTGICTDISNKPLSNIIVELHSTNSNLPPYSGVTNRAGIFIIDSVPEKEFNVKIPAYTSFPEQWYSQFGNTLYSQYKMWISPAMEYDTLQIRVTLNPIDNPPTSSLIVHVVDSSGNPLKKASIEVIRETDRSQVAFIYNDSTSSTLFSSLQPAQYAINVNSPPYPRQFYDTSGNSSSAKYFFPLTIEESKNITVTLRMNPSGSGYITGRVLNETSTPVDGLTLTLFRQSDSLTPAFFQTTTKTGSFAFKNIYESNYYLKISGGMYPDQWYSRQLNATILYPNDPIYTMPSVNDSFTVYVTSTPVNNQPKSVVKIRVYTPEGKIAQEFGKIALVEIPTYRNTTLTFDNSTNLYISTPQKEGLYALGFDIPNYPSQYYNPLGNTSQYSYHFALGINETLFVDAILKRSFVDTQTTTNYAYVSGTILDSTGPVHDAIVSIFEKNGNFLHKEQTDSNGEYKSIPVPAATIYLSVEAPGYPRQYWTHSNGRPTESISSINLFSIPALSIMTADMFLVTNPEFTDDSTRLIDTNTISNWSLSGHVSCSGISLSGIRIVLIQNDNLQYGFSPQNIWSPIFTYTDSSGNYYFDRPPQGNYLIAAIADSANCVTQFYKSVDIPRDAKPIQIGTATISGISFTLRVGGIVTGSVVDESGAPVSQAHISLHEGIQDGRHYETISNVDGSWKIQGVPNGIWYTSINHDLYLQKNYDDNIVNVKEGTTLSVKQFIMQAGGKITGTVSLNSSVTTPTTNTDIRGSLLLYPTNVERSNLLVSPIYRTHIQFINDITSTGAGTMTFISGSCPPGTYRALFTPDPNSWTSNNGDTSTFTTYLFGYGYFNGFNSFSNGSTITIEKGKTTSGHTLSLRSGSSLFATIYNDNTLITANNYNVTAFVQSGEQYYEVSPSYRLENGRVELPGLIDGEQYFIKTWAEGFPDQFWSPTGTNTTFPKDTYTFNSTQSKNITIKLLKQPEGSKVDINQYISLWLASDSSAFPTLKWMVSPGITIDSMYIYTRSKTVASQKIAAIPYSIGTNEYKWTDTRTLANQNEYCIVGQGTAISVRSDRIMYDSRKSSVSSDDIWLDVRGSRHGIEIEWKHKETILLTEQDSVILFKRTAGGTYREIDRRNGFNHYFFDNDWSSSDLLKTFEYKVEIPTLGKHSSEQSFTLTAAFFAGLAKEFRVGSGEKYSTIQQAIDAASDFDMVVVNTGIYREQLNFRGKAVSLYGQMQDGNPVTIDASGGTAITIPYNKTLPQDQGNPFIYGIKITNAKTGIETHSPIHIDRCLFTNVTEGIRISPEKDILSQMLQTNPFTETNISVHIQNSTFIASRANALAAYLISYGASSTTNLTDFNNYDRQLIQPLKQISSHIKFYNTLFAYYETAGKMPYFPVYFSGDFSSAGVSHSATWQTATKSLRVNSLSLENNVSYDPQFKDTINYFSGDSSVISSLKIGYRENDYHDNDNKDQKTLTMVSDLTVFNRAVDKIELRWNPSPLLDSIVQYHIYRIPGDPSLFYVNNESFWDITIDEDSLMSVTDTFSTENTWFIDNSVKPGAPYLYLVCAVDANNNESEIRIPASRPIHSYFSNVLPYTLPVKRDQWYMISPWGKSSMNFSSTQNSIIYQWDPTRKMDKLLSYYTPVDKMTPGKGYWFKSLKDTSLNIASSTPKELQQIQDTLRCKLLKGSDGWNQIASPFPHTVNSKLPSKYVIWEWDADSKGYKRSSMMEPWKAYWVFTEKDTTFLFNSGDNNPTATKTLSKRTSTASWELQLSLKSNNGNDLENILGVIPMSSGNADDFDVPEPPQPFGGNHIYFIKDQTKNKVLAKKQNLSYQYITSELLPTEKLEWQLGIASSDGASTISISGIESCPKELSLFWIYKGSVINLRKVSTITVDPSATETFGYVVATASPIDFALYSGTFNLRAPYPNPSAGKVNFEYVIPYQWDSNGLKSGDNGRDVSIMLYDLSGREIVTILNGKKPPGKHKAFWNGTSQAGRPLGAGVYILRFRCGDFVKNVQMFRVR